MDLIYPEHTLSEKWDIPVELNGRFSWNQDKKSWSDMMVLLNKDSFKSSGEWGDNGGIIDISADTLTLDVYLPNIQQVLTSKKLFDIPEKIPNLNLNLVSKDFNYADIQGKQLRLKAVLQDQKLQISSFDC
jgi:autotransporter translocation and assembly factor TamB